MSSSLKIVLSVEKDGVPVAGFPFVRRLVVDELQEFAYEQANHGDAVTFSAVPADQLGEIQVLVLRSDKLVTLRLDGQSDAGIVVNAGGLVLLVDADVDAGAGASNAKLNNNSGATATIRGLAGGT